MKQIFYRRWMIVLLNMAVLSFPSVSLAESYGEYGVGVGMGEQIMNAKVCDIDSTIIDSFKNNLMCTMSFTYKDQKLADSFIQGFESKRRFVKFSATNENCKIVKINMLNVIEESKKIISHEKINCQN